MKKTILIDAEELKKQVETARETTDSFLELIDKQPRVRIKLFRKEQLNEKLIRALEETKVDEETQTIRMSTDFRDATIEALKESNYVAPVIKLQGRNKYYHYYICPACHEDIDFEQKFCSECGRPIKWE